MPTLPSNGFPIQKSREETEKSREETEKVGKKTRIGSTKGGYWQVTT
jgi:hypothetical protein